MMALEAGRVRSCVSQGNRPLGSLTPSESLVDPRSSRCSCWLLVDRWSAERFAVRILDGLLAVADLGREALE